MSGLLRRIKRSRTADAGEPPAREQAAAPEGAPTPAGGAEATELPAATAPAVQADPARPAGLEPADGTPRPAGRRGRLRRRLRYLRRARELMLRDLGGLVYEVHRSGGGDYGAHANVIGGKIERLATLDAEAGAIEEVLGARRPESVVFQPGVGGTCHVCGELYGSAARFCSNCGSATDPAARAAAAPTAAPSEPRVVPPMPKPPAPPAEDRPTRELAAAEEKAATAADEPPATGEPATDAPTVADKAAADAPTVADPPGDAGRNPFSGISNGRPEQKDEPPELSSGDPLATRESRQ
jgi:hypothetical protein